MKQNVEAEDVFASKQGIEARRTIVHDVIDMCTPGVIVAHENVEDSDELVQEIRKVSGEAIIRGTGIGSAQVGSPGNVDDNARCEGELGDKSELAVPDYNERMSLYALL